MTPRTLIRRGGTTPPSERTIVACFLALVLLVTGCTRGDGDRDATADGRRGSPRPGQTVDADDTNGTPNQDGTGETGDAQDGNTDRSGDPPRRVAEEGDPPPAEPSGRGNYLYSVYSENENKDVGRFEVDAATPQGTADDRSQRITTEGFEYPRQTSHVRWRPDARIEERIVYEIDGERTTCDWQPDLLTYRLPLERGTSWTAESTCSTSSGEYTATTTKTERAEVATAEQIEVDGRVFDVWIIERERTETVAPFGLVVRKRITERFAPGLGLPVWTRERETKAGPGGGSSDRTLTFELIDLPG